MKKIAFTNGRYAGNILNILLVNGKVAGVGYLPDDDEGTEVIDIAQCTIQSNAPISLFSKPNFTILKGETVLYNVTNGEITYSKPRT